MREQLRVHTERHAQVALKRAATLDFIEEKTNCVFVGPSGVGKTLLANAIGQLACLRGFRVRFVLASDLVNDLVAGQARNTLHRRLLFWTCQRSAILSFPRSWQRGGDLRDPVAH